MRNGFQKLLTLKLLELHFYSNDIGQVVEQVQKFSISFNQLSYLWFLKVNSGVCLNEGTIKRMLVAKSSGHF